MSLASFLLPSQDFSFLSQIILEWPGLAQRIGFFLVYPTLTLPSIVHSRIWSRIGIVLHDSHHETQQSCILAS
jgi:hypothetical protein